MPKNNHRDVASHISKLSKSTQLVACFCLLTCLSTRTEASMEWQDFSLTYLRGHHYEVGDSDRHILTFEHAAGFSWGDSFLFWDHAWFDDGDSDDYGEWSPRLSLCKTKLYCLNNGTGGFIEDLLLSATVEVGDGFVNWLYGGALQLKVPGFSYFNVNVYRRANEDMADNWQTTLTWALPFQLGEQHFLFDGFLDWASTSDDQRSNLNWTSQVKWNVGQLWNLEHPLFLGVEYVYWTNKFGIQDSPALRTDESNLNFLFKVHF